MARNWTMDEALVQAISQNIYEALPLLPKRFIRVDSLTKELGMPFSHIQILCMLAKGEMSIGKISVNLGIAKPNITPLLDVLHDRGLVERCRSEKDRRIVNVRLLPAGEEMARSLQANLANQVKGWPADFSPSDIRRLNNSLAYLIEVAHRLSNAETDEG